MLCDTPKPQKVVYSLLEEVVYVSGFFYLVTRLELTKIRVQVSADQVKENLEKAMTTLTNIGKS